jgi:hypothetical protein
MRLELFGAIALATLSAAACNSDESTVGQTVDGTGGAATGVGGALTGTGASTTGNGGSTTGNGGSQTGNGGSSTGNGGSTSGNGGSTSGNGGSTPGNGGSQGTSGAGGVGTVVCPATAPNDGDTCTGRGTCSFGSETCACVGGGRSGGARTWRCFTVPDGGFGGFPGRDGGFTIPDGGFPTPTTCTQGSDCTGGNVCCTFQGGRGTFTFCASSSQCSQIGGSEVP